ncbi:MAG: cation-translocating P-type ATPase family protein [Planctomycetaceae bacterium]|nr:cation-translocating P-type ATPase family protein [Planctomycetaceae bacterium]
MLAFLQDPHQRHRALTVLVAAALVAYLTGTIETIYGFDLAMLAALVGGFPIYSSALAALARKQISADLAVSLAAFAALYLGYTGGYSENMYLVAAEVILIMLIGEALEHYAIDRTRDGIAALLALRPETARVRAGDHDHVVPIDEIERHDIVVVRPGDRIPVDGRVVSGHSTVDQSPITGESVPADKMAGDEVFAGTINLHGAMELEVERVGEDTALEQIIHLVEHAEAAKAPTQRLADKYATWFVPIVLVAAGLSYYFTRELVRSVAILVVACPCALVLATPTAIAATMGALVRRGVLIKGGAVLEKLGRLRSIVFDKTGTLTLARLRIDRIVAADGYNEDEVLRLGAAVERHSEHPVGKLIAERAEAEGLVAPKSSGFAAQPGLGAEALVDSDVVRVGSVRFLEQAEVVIPAALQWEVDELCDGGATVVLVSKDRVAIGAVAVKDTVRAEAATAVRRLRELGVERIVMLTGDNRAAAGTVAEGLGIDDVRAALLPADKVAAVKEIQKAAGPTVMVGDGINDAPSLVTADVGVAMADIGTDVAIASADVVLVGDDLRKLPHAIRLSRWMLKIIWQNILWFAVAFNVAAVVAAGLGWVSPLMGAVLHQVSSLIVVLNSMRLLVDYHAWKHWWADWKAGLARRRRKLVAAAVLIALLAYAASGVHVVRIGQVAVVQQFGKIVRAAEPPGLHYRLPAPFGRHTIVNPGEMRRVEVGFRTVPGEFTEPPAYEWNVQHRGGRFEGWPEESTVLTGDESLVDVTLTVQYRVSDPVAALVRVGKTEADGTSKWDRLVRIYAESELRAVLTGRAADEVLSLRRDEIEQAILAGLQAEMQKCGSGFSVESVCLADVHPPLEVVPAFREVAAAQEEKEAAVNDAEAYRFEAEALTEGEAVQKRLDAEGFSTEKTAKASGEAERFTAIAEAHQAGREVNELRLHLEAVEEMLAGRRKIIVDHAAGGTRRQLYLGPKTMWSIPLRQEPDATGNYDDTPVPQD